MGEILRIATFMGSGGRRSQASDLLVQALAAFDELE